MKIYLVETNARWNDDNVKRQAFDSLEKAQKRMAEIYNRFVEKYPNAYFAIRTDRAHVWIDADIYSDDWNEDNIADIYIRELEVH